MFTGDQSDTVAAFDCCGRYGAGTGDLSGAYDADCRFCHRYPHNPRFSFLRGLRITSGTGAKAQTKGETGQEPVGWRTNMK